MGELCRKQGERILNDIVPILWAGAESSDSKTREGVCFAISEVLSVHSYKDAERFYLRLLLLQGEHYRGSKGWS